MRTGNISSLTERDWVGVRERREFERQFAERERLTQDQAEYQKYVQIIEDDQRLVSPAYQIAPLDFDTWRSYGPQQESDPVLRGVQASNAALLSKVRTDEAAELEAERQKARDAVLAGNPDPTWTLPSSAVGLRMGIADAKKFAKAEAEVFLASTPSYYPCQQNWDRMRSYIESQGVNIPDRNVFAAAFSRLSELGLLEQPAPEPTPQGQPVTEPVTEQSETVPPEAELAVGWDLQTGEPRKYRPYEVRRMSADEYRVAFRVSPRFTRGYFGARQID